MGKKSVKENKNIYFQSREAANLTRAQASEIMGFISESRIEKIENDKVEVHPEDVVAMAEAYKCPGLCNYFCSHECPIGQENVPELEYKSLAEITLAMLSSLNSMEKYKDRFIEITSNGLVYANSVVTKNANPSMVTLVKAMYLYSQAAEAHFSGNL